MIATEEKVRIGISWIGKSSDSARKIYKEAYSAFFNAVEKCGANRLQFAAHCFQ